MKIDCRDEERCAALFSSLIPSRDQVSRPILRLILSSLQPSISYNRRLLLRHQVGLGARTNSDDPAYLIFRHFLTIDPLKHMRVPSLSSARGTPMQRLRLSRTGRPSGTFGICSRGTRGIVHPGCSTTEKGTAHRRGRKRRNATLRPSALLCRWMQPRLLLAVMSH